MSTRAYANMMALARGIEAIFPSAVCSGVVGDRRHRARGGYHLSRADNPKGNYSVVRSDDKSGQGPDDAAAAVDMTMNARDMKLATQRLVVVWQNKSDPRRKYVNAFNGWLGTGDAARWDVVAQLKKWATPDHTWHLHAEVRRLWVLSAAMVKAILSALRGESVADYLRSIGVVVPPTNAAVKPRPVAPVPAPKYPGRVLRRNDRASKPDAAVKQFQTQMRARGWTSVGPADGLPGAKFESVVRRWQAYCKLAVDGEVGPKTWPTPWTKPFAA